MKGALSIYGTPQAPCGQSSSIQAGRNEKLNKSIQHKSTHQGKKQVQINQTMGLSSIFGGSAPSQQQTVNSGSGSNLSGGVTGKVKSQISQELAVANATELVNKVTENCFEKCLHSPYTDRNEPCVDQCLIKYMRSWNIVSKAYISRIQQASTSGEI